MDCPICYERINYSAIGTCTHHFCFTCLINWCKQGGELCPICNTRIETIRPDIEFDKLKYDDFPLKQTMKYNPLIGKII